MNLFFRRSEEATTDRDQDEGPSTVAAGFFRRAADDFAAAGAVVADKGDIFVRSGAAGTAAGFGVAYDTLSGFARNLDWNFIDHSKYLEAGTRGVSRGIEEARLVWESIPAHLRALGPEEVTKRLEGFHWSHIIPHSKGGGNEAANGIFERAGYNRPRGAEPMTGAEIEAAAHVLSQTAFEAALREIASQALVGAAVGAAASCVISCLEFGLEYQRGNIDRDEMFRRIGWAMAKSAGVGAAISGIMAAAALAYPSLLPLAVPLMLPLAALGFYFAGRKVVRLGKGWYELYRMSPAADFPIRFPFASQITPVISVPDWIPGRTD